MTESERNLKLKCQINATRLVCVIIILILIIVSNWVGDTYTDETLTSYFSFASTITSIILSVIAIILSVVSSDSINQVLNRVRDLCDDIRKTPGQINESVNKIDVAISNLNEVPAKVTSSISELARVSKDINDAVLQLSSKVSELTEKTAEISEKIKSPLKQLGTSSSSSTTTTTTTTVFDIWRGMINNGSPAGILLLYALLQYKKEGRDFFIDKFIQEMNFLKIGDYFSGYFVALLSSGLVKSSNSSNPFSMPIQIVSVELESDISMQIEKLNNPSDPSKIEFVKAIRIIDEMLLKR